MCTVPLPPSDDPRLRFRPLSLTIVRFINVSTVCVCMRVCTSTTQSDLEESASALKSAMEQAKRSANDATHLSDELRQQNDRNATLEKQRRLHEAQIKELQVGQLGLRTLFPYRRKCMVF